MSTGLRTWPARTASESAKLDLPRGIVNQWTGAASVLPFGQETLRFWWLGSGPRVSVDDWIEASNWEDMADSAPVVSGSITLRQSLVHSPIPPIHTSDLIVCEMQARPAASWKELWRLRVSEAQRLASGGFTFQLENDAALLLLGEDDWRFPKDKQHPHGWKPWQIIAEVCRRCRVLLVMPKTGKPIKKFPVMKKASPVDVINAALKHLRDVERKTMIRRFEHNVLYISPRHYSPELVALGPQLIEASLVEMRKETHATSLTVRATAEVAHGKDKKGKKKATHRAISINVERPAFIKRYGYVHRIVYAHGADSVAEAKQMGLAHLARVLVPNRTLTLSSPYIPGLRRGGYVRLAIPPLGLTQIVYVKSVTVSANSGSLTMDVTVGFEDPQVTPPVDKVNATARDLAATTKKKTNPDTTSVKRDATTAQKPKATASLGGVVSQ